MLKNINSFVFTILIVAPLTAKGALADFQTTLANPTATEKQIAQLETSPLMVKDDITELHLEKLREINKLFNRQSESFSLKKPINLSQQYQWKKTHLKLKNIETLCIDINKIESCVEEINNLKDFISTQDLIENRKEKFLVELENIESAYIDFWQNRDANQKIFNNSHLLITQRLNSEEISPVQEKMTTKNIMLTPDPALSLKKTTPYIYFFLALFVVPLALYLLYRVSKKRLDKYKSQKEIAIYLEKFKFKKECSSTRLAPYVRTLKDINDQLKIHCKKIKIRVAENQNETNIRFEINLADSVFIKIDEDEFSELKNTLIKLATFLDHKSDIALSDLYDDQGEIKYSSINLTIRS